MLSFIKSLLGKKTLIVSSVLVLTITTGASASFAMGGSARAVDSTWNSKMATAQTNAAQQQEKAKQNITTSDSMAVMPANTPMSDKQVGMPASTPMSDKQVGMPASTPMSDKQVGMPANTPMSDKQVGMPANTPAVNRDNAGMTQGIPIGVFKK